jgi:hypothetical protein
MTRSVTSPAEQQRRRDIMAAAMVRARADRLAAEAARAAVVAPQMMAPKTKMVGPAKAAAVASAKAVAAHAPPTAAARSVAAAEALSGETITIINGSTQVAVFMREHGDANHLRVISVERRPGSSELWWTVECAACSERLWPRCMKNVTDHVNSRAHTTAVESGRGAELSVQTWMREHGEANQMALVLKDMALAPQTPRSAPHQPGKLGRRSSTATQEKDWAFECDACHTVTQDASTTRLQRHVVSAMHVGALAGRQKHGAVQWMHDHGVDNKMSITQTIERSATQHPTWIVTCAACNKEIRATGKSELEKHAGSALHAAAMEGREQIAAVPEWLREHGAANQMTFVSKDLRNGKDVWSVQCSACGKLLHAQGVSALCAHANTASHAGALATGTAPANLMAVWLREHGEANTMTLVSNDETNRHGQRIWVVRCGACDKSYRATAQSFLTQHAVTPVHAAALASGCGQEHPVPRWIRENGDHNMMAVTSNDELRNDGHRAWLVRCGACKKDLRVEAKKRCVSHAASPRHLAALESHSAPAPALDCAQRKRPR